MEKTDLYQEYTVMTTSYFHHFFIYMLSFLYILYIIWDYYLFMETSGLTVALMLQGGCNLDCTKQLLSATSGRIQP